MPGPNDENGCPVMRITSSARTMRRELPGSTRRGHRIDSLQLGVRGGEAFGVGDFRFELGTDGEILGRKREWIDDRLQVQAGAADEQRALAARLDVGNRVARRDLEARHRPVFRRVGDVDQVVRDRGSLADRGLGRPDVEPAVDLHRVDRDDLDVAERVRRGEREVGLAGSGGADECEVRHAGAAVTGIRTRRSTRSPRRKCGAAEVIRTARVTPARWPTSGSKWTSLFWRVRPAQTAGSRFDGPSTKTCSVRPTRLVLRQRVPLDHVEQPLHALLHDVRRHEVVGHVGGGRTRPRREHEGVRGVVRSGVDHLERALEVGVGLAREPDDEIGGDGEIRDRVARRRAA